jgi:hypothetical protein
MHDRTTQGIVIPNAACFHGDQQIAPIVQRPSAERKAGFHLQQNLECLYPEAIEDRLHRVTAGGDNRIEPFAAQQVGRVLRDLSQDRRRFTSACKRCPQQCNARLLRNRIGLTMTARICASDRNQYVTARPGGRPARTPRRQPLCQRRRHAWRAHPQHGLWLRQGLDLRAELFLGRSV